MQKDQQYPECFPTNIDELIRRDGASENILTYYRISKSGLINRDAFLSTYEESLNSSALGHNRDMYLTAMEEIDIGDYSTSGFEKANDAKKLLNCMRKYREGPVIIAGQTNPACGLSMRTKDSKTRKCKNSHIDWWIYKGTHPEIGFKKYGVDENEDT